MLLAVLFCCATACAFVVSLNLVSGKNRRDHPTTVSLRIFITAVVIVIVTALVFLLFGVQLQELGVQWEGALESVLLSLLSSVVLFMGPLYQNALQGEILTTESKRWDITIRNLIVAPIAEEWIFRACMLSVLLPEMKSSYAVVLSPFIFGLSHLHHLLDWVRDPKASGTFTEAGSVVLFQFCYTFVFGIYSAYLFVVTGNILGPIAAHLFCNLMGFPDIGGIAETRSPKSVWILYIIGAILFIFYLYYLPYLL